MSDNPSISPIETSNELVRWFQLLVLPLWARAGLLVLMGLIISSGVALLVFGILRSEKDAIAAAMTLLTVALPVLLIVVAIVFGQQGDQRLRQLTLALLQTEIPASIQSNIEGAGCSVDVRTVSHGCRADYVLVFSNTLSRSTTTLLFSVELNVHKVNVAFWIADLLPADKVLLDTPVLQPYRHVISGALKEGYSMNQTPAYYLGSGQGVAALFVKILEPQFLLKPAARLYFCQDLAFFVRGVLEARYSQQSSSSGESPASVQ